MPRPKIGMTPRKKKAANMIGQGADNKTVAKQIGVSLMTVYNWLQEDIFVDAILAASDRHLARVVPEARQLLYSQMGNNNAWLAQNAANSLLRERGNLPGNNQQQVMVSFSLDDTEPTLPDNDSVPLISDGQDDV